jgi:hypothetical protein
MTVLTKHPRFVDMDTASPAVSPSVMAASFIIQKINVTSGPLLMVCSAVLSVTPKPRTACAVNMPVDVPIAIK